MGARFRGLGTELSSLSPEGRLVFWAGEVVAELGVFVTSALRELNEEINSRACAESPNRFFR